MIQRSTVVYIVLLIALVGAYFYLKNRERPAELELTPEPTSEILYLFSIAEGVPTNVRIEAKTGEIVEVARDAENNWELAQPNKAAADPGAAEAAVSQITSMRVVDTVPSGVDPELVGLDIPQYVLIVNFTSGGERIIDIGVLTPSESGYYVRDREAMDKILIVSSEAIDSLIYFLQNPPYLETPTALPASPEAGVAPDTTATPQP